MWILYNNFLSDAPVYNDHTPHKDIGLGVHRTNLEVFFFTSSFMVFIALKEPE